jgi:transcriptional regulator with XRE-family HTH domain
LVGANGNNNIKDLGVAIVKDRLKNARKTRDLRQSDLEEISGIPQNTISRIELGKNPDVLTSTLAALAKALNVSTDYLLGLKDEPE